tara:strand:- start:1489 stop:1722 length:234 start_codon:yes stop_codon:yes gene_type:complete
MRTQSMAKTIFQLNTTNQSQWDDVMSQMFSFCCDQNADIDMAYDWVCEMMECDGFVENETAWDSFYDTFTEAYAAAE